MSRRPVPSPPDTYDLVPLGSPAGTYNLTELRRAEADSAWRSRPQEDWQTSARWQYMSSTGSTVGVGDGFHL
jgi:hypothetical protein